ncbi:MAG: carbohydrate ABC transporter permease, partial [Lachnospiraceae bacterium]|nr:carbohydrate ABC transporter permease [Lachnospiraceae bacterium]
MEQFQVKKTNKVLRALIYIGLVIWALIDLFPIYWMFTFSLKSNEEVYGANVMGLPRDWIWDNYTTAMTTGNMPLYFMNSVIVTLAAIVISLIAALMATYALTRIVWKGAKTMNAFFMLGITIPIHSSIVPIFVTLSRMKMTNSYWSLIIPYAAFSLAMAILICTGFMNDIPKDLDEAAYIDGCTLWQTFIQIICPLMKPALATISIYTFLQCWNELMFANVFISKSSLRTLPVGIQALSGQHTTEWGPIGAALVIATF